MLDAFIIEELKKRDRLRRRQERRPTLEIPRNDEEQPGDHSDERVEKDKDGERRGVIIIDYGI